MENPIEDNDVSGNIEVLKKTKDVERGNVAAVVVAAGKGSRTGASIPKQFIHIDGEAMVFKSVSSFLDSGMIDEVILVTSEDYIQFCRENFAEDGRVQVVQGGSSRQKSVSMGLAAMSKDIKWVLIHDGARPFVDSKLIGRVLDETVRSGACICGVTPIDTIRHGQITLKRDELVLVQTPQGFSVDTIVEAHRRAEEENFQGTDDASLVQRMGKTVEVVRGDVNNKKITDRGDLPMENRVGHGYDVHRLVAGRKLILGGVEIEHHMGLDGHSDADVLLHSAMDALLGAAGLGDIGFHFPDTEEEYRGISSVFLLEKVKELIYEAGYVILNIDVTVEAQRPKLSPYRDRMKESIVRVLGINPDRINVKMTTTEGLGFVGRGEGIAATTVCMLGYKY